MQSVQTLLTEMVRSGGESVAKAAGETGDKITWQPLDKGRSALNLAVECAWINRITADLLETGQMPDIEFVRAGFQQLLMQNDTAEKALGVLTAETERLAKALEAFPTENLNDTVTLPFWGGMEKTIAQVVGMTYWNMTYHEGQIIYIQTLYKETS